MKSLRRPLLVVVLGAIALGIAVYLSHRVARPGIQATGASRAPLPGDTRQVPPLLVAAAPLAAVATGSASPDAFQSFDRWAQEYRASATPETQHRLLADGERLAAARYAELVKLVRSNPKLALARALPYSLRKTLPASFAPHLEQPVDTRGSLQVIHSVPLPEYKHVHLPTLYRATINKTEYETFAFGKRQRAPRRSGLPLHGITVIDEKGKNLMALSDQPMRLLEEEEATDRLAATKSAMESRCRHCAKPTPANAVHVDCGGEILAFCSIAEFQQASSLFADMEDASTAPRVYAAPPAPQATPPDQLPPPTPGIHIGAQKLLLIPVEMAYDPIPVTPVDELWRACEYNNAFYVEDSYGIMSWISTVTPTVKVPEGRLYYAEAPEAVLSDAFPRVVAMGYNPNDYFMTYVVFNSLAPSVRFGGRSDGLFNGGPWAIDHELGHNIGVIHANYLNMSGVKPAPPYPPPARPNAPYPVDIESSIGHDDINAPVVLDDAMEVYGDPYDRMGGGGGHFSVYFKYLFDWLPANFLRFVGQSATNRIYAFDTPSITDGRAYGIRIPKNPGHEGTAYWLSYRQAYPDNPWMENGLYLQWEAGGNILLMDTTPLTFLGKFDGSVVVGRTFHDPEIQAHITPIAKGSDGPSPSDKWMDVVVNIGNFPGNIPPSFTLTSSPPIEAGQIVIPLGGTVTLGSQAQDPDGDLLGYYWEFGDLTVSGSNSPVVTKTYTTAGRFNLRHEVSDLRGGVVSRNLTVVVGDAATFTISGYVTDEMGNPVPNVVVHNCGSRPEEPELNEGGPSGQGVPDFTAGTFRSGVTDSDGYYIIGNVSPGVYTNRAFRFGYITERLFTDPVRVTSGDVIGLNHLATSLPHVSIEPAGDAVEAGGPGAFIARRTGGDISLDLPVKYQIGGDAVAGQDYEPFPTEEGQFVFPAWSDSVVFNVNPIDNGDATGPKTVTVSLFLQPTNIVIGSYTTNVVTTNEGFLITNTVFLYVTNTLAIPGWQTNWVGDPVSRIYWFQTYPTYVLGAAQATVNILDDEPIGLPTVVVWTLDANASETREDTAVVAFSRSGGDRTLPLAVHYSVSGDAVNGDDIYMLPGTIPIPANEDYVLLPIKAVNDLFVEGNEGLTLTLEPDPAYEGFGSADLTIVDNDLPELYIFSTDSVGDKTGNRARVTIARSGDLREPLLVNYLVSGTAVNARDYQPLPGSVTIPAGQISASIDIIPVTNSPSVGAQTVVIHISDSPMYNIDSHDSATVTIRDRLPVVTVSPAAGTVAEGATIDVTFTRTGDTSNALQVFFAVGGTAAESFDFAGLGTNVLIPAGSLTKTMTINAIDDGYREMGDVTGNDMIEIHLVSGPDYNLGGATSVKITITDNDGSALPGIGFMTSASAVREDDGIAWVGVRVTANPATNRPAWVDCIVSGGTAVPNTNYTPFEGGTNRLLFEHFYPPEPPDMFLSPQDGIQFVMLPIFQDRVVTTNKTIQLRLLNPNGWLTNVVAQTNTNTHVVVYSTNLSRIPTNFFLAPYTLHTITILDVDQNVVSVSADSGYVYEAGPVGANFIISREGSVDRPLTVHYAVPANAGLYTAAAPGNDYVAFTTNFVGSITIPAGTNRVLLPIIPLDDPTEESAEPIAIELLDRPGYQVGTRRAQVIIVSNDGTVQFARSVFEAPENSIDALLEVVRSGDTNLTVSFEYDTADGSALDPEDYLASSGTLTFLPGETSKTISVPLVNDTAVEGDETFSVRLVNTSGGVPLGGQRTAVVRIVDDDVEFTFATNSFRAPENSTNALIEVVRLGQTNREVSVRFFTMEVSPNQNDYLATNLTLTFLAGQTNYLLPLPIFDDAQIETNETVRLVLANPSTNTALGPLPVSELVIVEDDCAIGFSQPVFSVKEYLPAATLTVQRRGGTVNPVTLDFFTYDGTATNGTNGDYFTLTGTLNFRGDRWELSTNGDGTLSFVPGDAALTIPVPLNDDNIGEGGENFFVALTNLVLHADAQPGSAVIDTNSVADVTLIDDELPGAVDYPFNAGLGPNGPVHAVAVQTNQSGIGIVFAGAFTTVDGINFLRIARWASTGVLDPSFNPGAGANATVYAVAIDPGGKVLMGGAFTTVDGNLRRGIARLNADGNIDIGFDPGSGLESGAVRAIASETNAAVLIGGDFLSVDGQAHSRIARLQNTGDLDPAFLPTANGTVHALAVQTNGAILVGGEFTAINGVARSGLARLTPAGQLDTSFGTSANLQGIVYSIAVQSDGKVVVGGAFISPGGSLVNLARLNADGSRDTAFTPAVPDGVVRAVSVDRNRRILVGGSFTQLNGASRNRYARLTALGAVDFSFNIGLGANDLVRALVVQPDTAVVIGGDFTQVDQLSRPYVARIHGDERSSVPTVQFAQAVFTVAETAGVARITVTRSGDTNGAFNIGFGTRDGTGSNQVNYVRTNGTLSFAAGQLSQVFDVAILDTRRPDGDRTVNLFLTNAPVNVDMSGITSAVLVIEEYLTAVRFNLADYGASTYGTNAAITVLREGRISSVASALFTTSDGTGQAPGDYLSVSNRVVFASGESNQIVFVPLGNAPSGGVRTFGVHLSQPDGCSIGSPSNATVTILSDVGVVAFGATNFGTLQGDPVTITLIRTNGTVGVVSVNLATSAGTALPGLNYLETNLVVTFADGQSSTAVQLTTYYVTSADGPLWFLLTLSDPRGGAVIGGTGMAAVNLQYSPSGPGGIDRSFQPGTGANGLVRALALQTDAGKVKFVVGGAFTNFNGVPHDYLARLHADGSVDTGFLPPDPIYTTNLVPVYNPTNPAQILSNLVLITTNVVSVGANAMVTSVAVTPNGRVAIGGVFTTLRSTRFNTTNRNHVAMLATNGVVESGFAPPATLNAAAYALLPVGSQLAVGGGFTLPLAGVCRLRADGATDVSFNSGGGVAGNVFCMAPQPNGQLLVGGNFAAVDGVARQRLARLSANGALDASFAPQVEGAAVYAMLVQPDGRLVIGGDFTNVNGVACSHIARLDASGVLDTAFSQAAAADAPIHAMGLDATGRLIVGGDFTACGGGERIRIARLLATGALDTPFDPGLGPNGTVYTLALLSDGRVVIGGDFTEVDGHPRGRVALLSGDARVQFLPVAAPINGVLTLVVSAPPGQKCVLEASANLATWTPVATNTVSGSTTAFSVNVGPAGSRGFYRVRVGP